MMQCKDIPDRPILELLDHTKRNDRNGCGWVMRYSYRGEPCILDAMPPEMRHMPEGQRNKLALAKMAMLIRRGLAEGCTCGCRGDFEITAKGADYLTRAVDSGGSGRGFRA